MSRPDFFRKRESDQLGLESFMQAALQASAQRQSNQPERPVGGGEVVSAAQGQADADTAAKIAELQQQLSSGLGKDAVQTVARLPKGTRDTASASAAAKFKYETQKQEAFNKAVSEGNLEEAMAIDPEATQQLLLKQQQLQQMQQQMQIDAAKAQFDMSNPKVQESALDKARAKQYAELLGKVESEAESGAIGAAAAANILPLFEKVYTGVGGEKVQAYRNIMAHLDPTKAKLDDAAIGEQIKNFGTNMALDLIAQTKGAVSDTEMDLYIKSASSLGNTPEGNRRLALAVQAINQRKVQRKLFFDSYLEKFPDDVSGANGAWLTYINTTPALIMDPTSGAYTIAPESWDQYLSTLEGPRDYLKPAKVQGNKKPTIQEIEAERKKRGLK